MSRCLRHEAECITEDGWVELPDLLEYLRKRLNWQEKYFTEQVIRDAVEENFKQRFVVRESDGRPYVAAWSGPHHRRCLWAGGKGSSRRHPPDTGAWNVPSPCEVDPGKWAPGRQTDGSSGQSRSGVGQVEVGLGGEDSRLY